MKNDYISNSNYLYVFVELRSELKSKRLQFYATLNFILKWYMLNRSLQGIEFRSSFRWKSFERTPHPKHFHAKLRSVPDRMFHGKEVRVIQLPGSLSKAGRTATDKRSWIFTPKEMTKSAFTFLLLFRTPAETTHVPRMHLAWMAFPRKATRVNVNWDLQAAIVRKVRTQASWPTVWTVCHYPCALFSTDPSRFALQEDARVKEYSPQ